MADTFEGVLEILGRTDDLSDLSPGDLKRLSRRVDSVRYWLNGFAPDSVKFSVCPTVPAGIELSMGDKVFLQALSKRIYDCVWDADTIANIISETAKESPIGLKGGYGVMYRIFIGKKAGPRIGTFLAGMDKAFVVNRIIQAAQ